MMRRIIASFAIGVTLSAAAIILMPTAAHATAPTREPVEFEDFVLTDHCTFDILVEIVFNNEVLTTYYDANGEVVRQSVTGALKVRLTNQEAPEHSVFLNISGAGQYRFLSDGSTELLGTGAWLHFGITNLPGALLLTHGRFTAIISDEGIFLTELPNNVQDACALLS
jgi:hypothetical protein